MEEVDYFSCLYERYEERLLRYIRRIVPACDGDAEDILQESFLNIWKNLHAFDPRLKLSSWIYRIVHNQAVSCLRKHKSYGKDQQVEWDETAFASLPDEFDTGVAEALNTKDLLTRETLQQLPLPYKEVLLLKFLEGMSYEEISDVLKIPEGTVATRINRAKKAFRKLSTEKKLSFES